MRGHETGPSQASGHRGPLVVLLHDRLPPSGQISTLRTALPWQWREAVLLSVARRWYPPSSRAAPACRGERSRALREVWAEQELLALEQLAEARAVLRDGTAQVTCRFAWGEPVAVAHAVARSTGAVLIAQCVPAERGLLAPWRRGAASTLSHDAPCPVLIVPNGALGVARGAPLSAGRPQAAETEIFMQNGA